MTVPRTTAGRALVVGASSGIGRAIARELDALGHELVLWGRAPEVLADLAAACRSAQVQQVDVTDHAAMAETEGGTGPAATG